jgi:cytochrome b subunit of formate dehydrogenase
MTGYIALDYRKQALAVFQKPQVRRMSGNAVFQHALLLVSFSALVVTGFALRYSEAGLFRFLFGWDGGAAARGLIHRIAAVVFMFSCAWHLVYLRGGEGRLFFAGMAIRFRDALQFLESMRYNLGMRSVPPRLGRFSFVEKAEYWALLWGSVVMIATGLLLWFDNLAVRWVSKGFLDVMQVIHLFEAWLAFLAILVWHLYHVLYRPGVYPGNPAWLTGKMPRDMHAHEHPEDTEPRDAEDAKAGRGPGAPPRENPPS